MITFTLFQEETPWHGYGGERQRGILSGLIFINFVGDVYALKHLTRVKRLREIRVSMEVKLKS